MTMQTAEFLQNVITAPGGYFCLAFGGNGHGWIEEFHEWPAHLELIVSRAQELSKETNVYFSSYLFQEKRSLKQYVLPSQTIQADLDDADVEQLPLVPTILVRTSEGRHQGYWTLKEPAESIDSHEFFSKKLTYAIKNCDHSGWPLGRKVRVPGTLNYKYLEGPQQIEVVDTSMRSYSVTELELLPDVTLVEVAAYGDDFIDNAASLTELEIGPNELLESIKDKIPAKIYVAYNTLASDRSAALWALTCAAFRAGLTREQVFYLAKHSANNKFKDLHHHAERELAKDVVRAEISAKSMARDVRELISEARRLRAPASEKRQYIFNLILGQMKADGEFIRTTDENPWYIRRDLGRPVQVNRRSEYLDMILYLQYGVNRADLEHDYIVSGLSSWAVQLPSIGIYTSLSWYDNNVLLLHTGKKDVLRITPHEITRVTDGAFGIVFEWLKGAQPFNPVVPTGTDWIELLFGDAVDSVINITPPQAKLLLRTWMLFLLFKNAAISRPIIAFFGQQGSGKSTLFRRIYKLLYGTREINAITKMEDFDQAMHSDPFVVMDNVDTWQPWLPDRLAVSASASDILKRKLWSDMDTVIMRRQALLGVSAHNPKFGREDVTDRLLLINFERLQEHKDEGEIIQRILHWRNHIWGGIVQDIQRVLAIPMPSYKEAPQFRVEDFARIGNWIATALGYKDEFRATLNGIRTGQKIFNLEEDYILIEAINRFVSKSEHRNKFITAGSLWSLLETYSGDAQAFAKLYRNSTGLSKKLWVLQDSLKEIVDIEWRFDPAKGTRLWRLDGKTS